MFCISKFNGFEVSICQPLVYRKWFKHIRFTAFVVYL